MTLSAWVAVERPARAAEFGATAQLAAGQQEGTFAFRFSGKIKFAQEDAFPVRVVLTTDKQTPVVEMIVQDGSTFHIANDLPPGGYQIRSEVMPAKENVYWGANGPSFFINSEGVIRYLPSEDSLVHVKKLQILTPNRQHLATTRRSDMILRWAPLRGAVRYHLSWAEQSLPQFERLDTGAEDTPGQEFNFPNEVHLNRRYEFAIYGFDADGRKLGYSEPFYFYTVGAKKVAEPKVARDATEPSPLIGPSGPPASSAPSEPKMSSVPEPPTAKGAPFFGVRPQPIAGVGAEGRGGLRVAGIGFNSPASRAGMKLDDVITNFNGVTITSGTSVDEFTALVRNVPPGTKVIVEYYRKNVRMLAEVTIVAKR